MTSAVTLFEKSKIRKRQKLKKNFLREEFNYSSYVITKFILFLPQHVAIMTAINYFLEQVSHFHEILRSPYKVTFACL